MVALAKGPHIAFLCNKDREGISAGNRHVTAFCPVIMYVCVINIREEAMTEKLPNTLTGQFYVFLSDSTLPACPALSFYTTGSSNLPLNCARELSAVPGKAWRRCVHRYEYTTFDPSKVAGPPPVHTPPPSVRTILIETPDADMISAWAMRNSNQEPPLSRSSVNRAKTG